MSPTKHAIVEALKGRTGAIDNGPNLPGIRMAKPAPVGGFGPLRITREAIGTVRCEECGRIVRGQAGVLAHFTSKGHRVFYGRGK